MRKLLSILFAILLSTSTFAMNADVDYTNSSDHDYSCKIKNESTIPALTLDKGDANIVKFDISVDKNTCEIKGIFPVQIYWEIGKKEKNGVIPCRGLTTLMRKYFGYKAHDIVRLSSSSIRMNMDIIKKASDIITPQIIIDVKAVDGECVSKVTFDIDGEEAEVDTLRIDMGLFSVSEVALIKDGNILYEE